jgi:hypothetical protein
MKARFEYDICVEDGIGKLLESVNKKIEEGFIPQGGICVMRQVVQENAYSTKHELMWAQAVVKKLKGRFD